MTLEFNIVVVIPTAEDKGQYAAYFSDFNLDREVWGHGDTPEKAVKDLFKKFHKIKNDAYKNIQGIKIIKATAEITLT